MKFFVAAILIVFAMLFCACKKEGSSAPPPETAQEHAQEAENADSLELLLLEQSDDAADDAETENAEPKRLSAPVPPSSAVSAPLAALAAKARPKTAPAPAKAAELAPPKPETAPDTAPKIAHAPNTWTEDPKPLKDKDAGQLSSGKYTIQVGVFPNETAAKKHIAQLAQSGINAYHTKVYNPSKLLGSHYRVRIGYFSERADAETYAKSKLEPIGYAWWVDLSKNDKIGSAELASE